MPAAPAVDDPLRSAAKQSAAYSSLLAAAAITLLKLITAVLTGSLGMLSETAHSGIDLVAAAITAFSVRLSDRPADEEHNYGHGKAENLSAIAQVLLMLGSAIWIAFEAIERIAHHQHLDLVVSPWPFLVLLLSIFVDFTRSRALRRVAREQRSDALAADALHFSTDIWSSVAVLIGLFAAYLGERFHLRALELADPIAALLVAVIILRVTWTLARSTTDSLLDATPPEVREELRGNIVADLASVPDVLTADRVRIRRSGSRYFVDLTLGLPRNLTFQRSEQVMVAAAQAVQERLPGADVVVTTVPTASLHESIFDRIRAVAARANLAVHDVSVQQYDGGLHVEQHLEVDETMTLRRAHDLVTVLESNIRTEVPELATVLTHIESELATIERPQTQPESAATLDAGLHEAARAFPEILDVHDIVTTQSPSNDGFHVRCHCTLPDDLPMHSVHTAISGLEATFRAAHPAVTRVLIHPEPATDNCR